MKKRFYLTFSALLVVVSCTIWASVTSFEVTVSVVNENDNLAITQKKPIRFPVIRISDSANIGDTCYTSDDSQSLLCQESRANTGKRKAGDFSVISAAETQYNITLSGGTEANGLRFTASLEPGMIILSGSRMADKKGRSKIALHGMLELVEPAVVATENTIFNYDVTLTYN